MKVRWVVRAGEGASVGDIVARAGGDARAIAEGRVFVGRRRAKSDDEPVSEGDEVIVAPPEELAAAVSVLLQEDDVVAVAKPAGIPTIPDHGGNERSLIAAVARAVGVDVSTLHATSRLDREVSGVVVFAQTPRAAERLAAAREKETYVRRYVALAHVGAEARGARRGAQGAGREAQGAGAGASASAGAGAGAGEWTASIGRAKDPRKRVVSTASDAANAKTLWRIVSRARDVALFALAPITGRTHQLRVHSAHDGAPLLGDRAYGGPSQLTLPTGRVLPLSRIALHCARVTLPLARRTITIDAPVPDDLREWWRAFGGDDDAWRAAIDDRVSP
jgi:23S rRNA pseudouridine1911/1915/1917 synthase